MRKTQMALTRLLSLLLVLAMLLGAMPLGVLAAEEPAVPDSEAQSGMSVTDVTAELTEEEMLQLFRENMDTELVQEADLPDLDEEVRVIVELDVDSLLDLRQEQNMETVAMGEFLETAAAQSLLLEIQETQDSVMAQMSAAGIAGELTYAYSTVTSGFAAKMTYGEMLQVAEGKLEAHEYLGALKAGQLDESELYAESYRCYSEMYCFPEDEQAELEEE